MGDHPCSGIIGVEANMGACEKRPNSLYTFICPKLVTLMSVRLLFRMDDPPGGNIWPSSMHE